MRRDHYDVLGVSRDAGPDELQQAYRRLSRRLHPDVNKKPGAEGRFREINEAYRVLGDPERRAGYDRASRGTKESPFTDDRGDGTAGIDIGDLFTEFFGTGAAGGPIPGADEEEDLELTVEEAFFGGPRRMRLAGRAYQVQIPAGVVDGQRIRLAGQGGRARGDARPGDLYLLVRIAPHHRYRLRGRDIHVPLPVSPWEAALGANVAVDSPGGAIEATVRPGSPTGTALRLRGRGMPNPRGNPGDLYAEIQVMVPRSPSARERELFEELAKVSDYDPRGQRR
jgi:curved DNA-binding protein